VAERFPDPAVQQSIAGDLALIDSDDQVLRALESAMVTTAKQHDAHTLYGLQPVPGMGTIRSLVLLSAMHDSARFPRVQACVSSCRLVKCAKESAGKRYGTAGTTIGNASLTWAFSEVAVLFLRTHPTGQKSLARLEKKHGTSTALTVLAHTLARAVSYLLQRRVACDLQTVLQREGR